jgi:hypothetical protein
VSASACPCSWRLGIPIALIASGAFSLSLLTASMALYASNQRARARTSQPAIT